MAKLQKIKELCRQKNITQTELARRVGITSAGLQKILNTNSTKIETLECIAKVLDVPITIFFDDDVKKASENLENEKLLKENIELFRENRELRNKITDLESSISQPNKALNKQAK